MQPVPHPNSPVPHPNSNVLARGAIYPLIHLNLCQWPYTFSTFSRHSVGTAGVHAATTTPCASRSVAIFLLNTFIHSGLRDGGSFSDQRSSGAVSADGIAMPFATKNHPIQ